VLEFIHEESDEISQIESVLGLACMELLKVNINFERPNSGVVVHFNKRIFLVNYDGEDNQLHVYDVTEDEGMEGVGAGTMIVMEPRAN
jgi:hypothetical protein